MKAEHKEMLDTVRSRSVLIAESGEEHVPMVFVLNADDEVHVAVLAGVKHQKWPGIVRGIAESLDGVFVAFVVEAWCAEARSKEECERITERARELGGMENLPPDDRMEALVLQYGELGEDSAMQCEMAIIDNRPEGRRCREWTAAGTTPDSHIFNRLSLFNNQSFS